MKQTVHFSKTEQLPDGKWAATIAPASIRKASPIKKGDYIKDTEFGGEITAVSEKGNEITIRCFTKFPCVGREYTIERK